MLFEGHCCSDPIKSEHPYMLSIGVVNNPPSPRRSNTGKVMRVKMDILDVLCERAREYAGILRV